MRETGRILLTGGTGFIGRHVVRALLAQGEAVTLAVRRAELPAKWDGRDDLKMIVCGDLGTATLTPLFEGVDRVVHLAGLAHVTADDRAFFTANEQVTGRLAEAAGAAGVRLFVNMSSLAAVSANATGETVSDGSPPRPVTDYGRSKLAAERHITRLAEARGITAISLRPPLVIGADAGGNWALLQRLAATGWPLPFASLAARRSFVSIDTLAKAIVHLCTSPPSPETSGAYCLADPDALRLPEVVLALRKGMGLPRRLFPVPKVAFDLLGAVTGRQRQLAGLTGPLVVDALRFFSTFGFTPSLPLADAIELSGRDYMATRRGAT